MVLWMKHGWNEMINFRKICVWKFDQSLQECLSITGVNESEMCLVLASIFLPREHLPLTSKSSNSRVSPLLFLRIQISEMIRKYCILEVKKTDFLKKSCSDIVQMFNPLLWLVDKASPKFSSISSSWDFRKWTVWSPPSFILNELREMIKGKLSNFDPTEGERVKPAIFWKISSEISIKISPDVYLL